MYIRINILSLHAIRQSASSSDSDLWLCINSEYTYLDLYTRINV